MRRGAMLFVLMLEAASGSDLTSALDRAMAGKPGTAVVADVKTGRVLASRRLDLARTRAAFPGSALKPFTLQAWLEAHRGAEPAPWPCPRRLRLAGRRFDCTHPVPAAAFDASTAVGYSCNCYFAHLALDLDPAGFARALRRVAGRVSTARNQDELQMQAIGEWGIEVTPLELLHAYRRLAMEPPKAILAGTEGAVAYGSAQLASAPDLAVAGKTGTASTHSWFAGFAPAGAPEIVLVVFLEQGSGGFDAAPIAGEIFRAYARGRR